MRLAIAIASYEPLQNTPRLRALRRALRKAKRLGIDLVCLPAGYLVATSRDELLRLCYVVVELARELRIGVAVGIDVPGEGDAAPDLPYLAVCWSLDDRRVRVWQQRSKCKGDAQNVSDRLCDQARIINVAATRIEILLCGEALNSRIRQGVRRRKPDAVVDLAHHADRFRNMWGGLRSLARDTSCFCCANAKGRYCTKYAYRPGRRRASRTDPQFGVGHRPRLEFAWWDL